MRWMRIGQESSYNGRFRDDVAVIDESGDLAALGYQSAEYLKAKKF